MFPSEMVGYYVAFLGLLAMITATWLKFNVKRNIHPVAWGSYAVIGLTLLTVSIPAFYPSTPSIITILVALDSLKSAGIIGVCYLLWCPEDKRLVRPAKRREHDY